MSRFQLTEEQSVILTEYLKGNDLVIEAGAGTGKTSTLRLLADVNQRKHGIYVAYNRAIANDAKDSFPRNTYCNTAHGLAYRTVGRMYENRLRNSQRIFSNELANRLDIIDKLSVNGRLLPGSQLARLASQTVEYFCNSDSDEITSWHIPSINGLIRDSSLGYQQLSEYIIGLAKILWDDIQLPVSKLGIPFSPDYYLKMWALTKPQLNADFILFDEAQDANPVIANVIRNQTNVQKIIVGDSAQAIYGWRGAIDSMEDFIGVRLTLTQSFRFGDVIANEANKWLTYLESKIRLRGYSIKNSYIEPLDYENTHAILCRTNAGAIREAITLQENGNYRVALVGGGNQIKRMAEAARDLILRGRTNNPDLFIFNSWEEVRQYVKDDEGGADLKVFVQVVDKFGVDSILRAVNKLVSEDNANIIISTAHKAKGREWETVRISTDFNPSIDDNKIISPDDSEAMLAYVTVTRAKTVLDNEGLSWIDKLI